MNIQELKRRIDEVDPEKFSSQVFVIVGSEQDRGGGKIEAGGVDVVDAKLAFDNGGPVFLLILEEDEGS